MVSAPRRVGLGDGLSEFNSLMQSGNSDFSKAWGAVQTQLAAEYGVGTQAYQDAIVQAQGAMGDAYSGLSQLAGVDPTKIADQARDYVLLGKTIAGAVSTVEGLVQDANSGQVTPAVVASFIGTMIGIGVTVGAVSAGVGAAIIGLAGAVVAIFQQFGLWQPSPPGGGSQQICNSGADGSDVFIGPVGPVYTQNSYGINYSAYKLGFTIGCLGVYVVDPANCRIEPASSVWRRFPNPNNPADSAWFQFGAVDGGRTGQPSGSWVFPWGGSGNTLAVFNMGWSKPNDNSAFANLNIRPIDAAFHFWRYLECRMAQVAQGQNPYGFTGSAAQAVLDFERAFFQAWKANQEYALNGLKPQSTGQVLVNLLRLWNRAHLGAAVTIGQVDMQPFQGDCPGALQPLYLNYVTEALQYIQSTDAGLTDGNGNLFLNYGSGLPGKFVVPPPDSTASTSSATGKKAVVGAVAVGGLGAAALGVYSYLTGKTIEAAATHLFEIAKGGLGHLFSSVGESAETAAEVATNETSVAEEAKTHRKTSHVQSLLFSKRAGWTVESARDWAWSNGYRSGKTHETENHIRLRQFPPHEGLRYRTVTFGRGISAVIAA